jgi:hypothetical protein
MIHGLELTVAEDRTCAYSTYAWAFERRPSGRYDDLCMRETFYGKSNTRGPLNCSERTVQTGRDLSMRARLGERHRCWPRSSPPSRTRSNSSPMTHTYIKG